MSIQYSTYPGNGATLSAAVGYSQCARLPHDIVKCSGQGGWYPNGTFPTSAPDEFNLAFHNVQLALEAAGSTGWPQVYLTRIYAKYFDDVTFESVVRELGVWTPDHDPLATVMQVVRLYEDMRVEVEVEAYLGQEWKAQ